MAPNTLWLTDSGKLAVGTGNAPHYCDTCPCGGPQVIERVLWEREQAADIETLWTVSTSYSIGDLIASATDDTINLRWFYRATTNHFSAAATEPGVGANWADEWEVATLTLAECQVKLNALGPYYIDDNAYTGGSSAPAAHPATYGNDAADLTDALEDAADLLGTLEQADRGDLDHWQGLGAQDPPDPGLMADAEADYQLIEADRAASIFSLIYWQAGFYQGNDDAGLRAGEFALSITRTGNAAFTRDVDFFGWRDDESSFSGINTDHGQAWVWAIDTWGKFSTAEGVATTTTTVSAPDPTGGGHEVFDTIYTGTYSPDGQPRWGTLSFGTDTLPEYARSRWDFNTYPNGYTA
jgi:hypothetical protein